MAKDGRRKKRIAVIGGAAIVVYVVLYVVISLQGQYVFTQSGKKRYAFGLAASDVEQWQPKFVYGQLFYSVDGKCRYRGNLLGVFFCPLVILDQKYFHETRWVYEGAEGYRVEKTAEVSEEDREEKNLQEAR